MLQIKGVKKRYEIGTQVFTALKGIDVSFRSQEFVAILGQSGSGKTTLLNIIGGLDKYDEGDLIIDQISTKNYKDKEWDAYRNHRIGFVFQNYNLIHHLDILSNVELALTLSGVDQKTRIEKAKAVLKRVGLEDHLSKKPNQLSGGQQQRVAIARALVNDPSIILADEPTGALDSETSLEIMNLLTEISKDKLIIMVTHNGELAKKYSSRIVKLKDGLVISDSHPYEVKDNVIKTDPKQRTSMSFWTALKLSFKNLLTKKVRTLITALAGSIGIIGVALVLSLQYGFESYLSDMERGTFAGLPINISRRYTDINALLNSQGSDRNDPVVGGIGGYNPNTEYGGINLITQEYIDYLNNSDINEYATVVYNYGARPNYFFLNEGDLNHNPSGTSTPFSSGRSYIAESLYPTQFFQDFFQAVSGRLFDQSENEAILVVDEYNRVPNGILEFLGLETGEDVIISFDEIVGKTFRIFTNDAYYEQDSDEIFRAFPESQLLAHYEDEDHPNVITVTIVGIVKSSSQFISVSEQILYSNHVQETILTQSLNSQIVQAQRASDVNVRTGQPFDTPDQKVDALNDLGGRDIPSNILIYPNDFDGKESVIEILESYNEGRPEEEQITHTDNVAAAISMIKTVMNAISAVLIAFSAISLFVSSVMIGIITYTSVLERTKEIGVLRSIGARKKDISRVFNAESILIGAFAGILGVVITYGLVPIINVLLREQTETDNVAQLFILHAVLLIVISIILTFIAGLVPSRIAARKDPVIALRSE